MNPAIAQLNDISRQWLFEDAFICNALSTQATRILTGAVAGLPEYPTTTGVSDGIPELAREVVVLADGTMWLYADEVERSVLTPGAVAVCHKCGDRDRIEGTLHVAWRKVIVEFALCVGCVAGYVGQVSRLADERGSGVRVQALKGSGDNG